MDFDNATQLYIGDKEVDMLFQGNNQVWKRPVPDTLDYLYFEAVVANTKVQMTKYGSPSTTPQLEYSTDKATWTPFVAGTDVVTLANVGDKVWFRNQGTQTALASSGGDCWVFGTASGYVDAGGWVTSLLDKTNYKTMTTLGDFALTGLFRGTLTLNDASNLVFSATTLGNRAYASMFRGNYNLLRGPKYWQPPLKTTSTNCCAWMFENCGQMQSGPQHFVQPHQVAAAYTGSMYQNFYKSCSSFKLPVRIHGGMVDGAYAFGYMFQSSGVNDVTVEWTSWGSAVGHQDWMAGVGSTGTFHKKSSLTLYRGTSYIPNGWTVLNDVK